MPSTYEVTIYKTDGTTSTVKENKKFFTLEWFQQQVGGHIETYPLGKKRSFVFHEEGRLMGLPDNTLVAEQFSEALNGGNLQGTVLVAPNAIL